MAQNKKVTPINSRGSLVDSIIEDGWYILGIKHQQTLYNPETKQEISFSSFIPRSEQDEAIKKIPKIISLEFKPNEPPYRNTPLGIHLNTYKRFEPKSAGGSKETLKYWQEFLERLFPIKTERSQVECFLAHMIQQPEQRPSYGIMLTSQSGTGKGWLYSKILAPLLNYQCHQVCSFNQVFQKHSTVLHESLLVLLDDPPANDVRTSAKLRSAITEPQITIEPKHEKQRAVPTYSRIILASNDRCPLELSDNDVRRWFIPQYITHQESPAETKQFLERFSETLCLDTLYHHLANLDITTFDCFSPKDTTTKEQIVELSKPEINRLVEEFLENHQEFHWDELDAHLFAQDYNPREVQALLVTAGFTSKRVTREGQKITKWTGVGTGVDRGK